MKKVKAPLFGEALLAALKAHDEGRLYYRCSDGAGRACNGGDGVVLPASQGAPGPWAERINDVECCQRGWHATTDPVQWKGCRVSLVEVDEVVDEYEGGRKVVCHTLRELCVVDQAIDARVWVAAHRPFLAGADLHGADLHGAQIRGADLQYADLQDAGLQGADLRGADLRGADLQYADLQDAGLQGADLHGAQIRGADLQYADLQDAGLQGADLRGADLRGADLQYADLRGADLRGADLRCAGLRCVYLRGAKYNGSTKWPSGFDSVTAGAVKEEQDNVD